MKYASPGAWEAINQAATLRVSFGQSHSSLAGVPLAQGGIDDVPLVVTLDP